jgi:cytidylate kinase
MIITISGHPGSGKDTVGKELAKRLGYRFCSMGQILEEIAFSKGLSLTAFNKLKEKDDSFDREIDAYQERLGRESDNLVVVSHIAARFIPHAFKVFLEVSPGEGARRVMGDLRNRRDESYRSLAEARKALSDIQLANERRYVRLYGYNPYSGKGYDLVIDTTKVTAKQVVKTILGELRKSGLI